MENLKRFLETGGLGKLTFGDAPEAVQAVLGTAPDVSVQRNPWIWKYGSLELTFYKAKGQPRFSLANISLYFCSGASLPEVLGWEECFPSPLTSRQEFLDYLQSQGMTPVRHVQEESLDYLVLPSGAHINFAQDKLHSIQFTAQTELPRKQLSLELPQEIFDQLQKEARKRSVSAAQLAAECLAAGVQQMQN